MSDNFDMSGMDGLGEDLGLGDLGDMFGTDNNVQKMDNVVLSQNLEGFANCFPEWDLHPPIK